MGYLILVKHAMPEIETDVPASQWRLSTAGRAAAASLARQLEPYAPLDLFSSPEPKACETAQIVSQHLGVDFETQWDLAEHRRDGVQFLQAHEFEAAVRRCLEEPDILAFGSETARQAAMRFISAVDAIQEAAGERNIVIISHGTVISLFVGAVTGTDPFRIWRQLGLPSYVIMSRPGLTRVKIVTDISEGRPTTT